MRSTSITTGPVRSAHGRVTARVDDTSVVLVRHAGWIDGHDWLVAGPVLLGIAALVGSALTDGGAQAVLGYAGAGLLLLALLVVVLAHVAGFAMLVVAALTRRGRREARRELRRLGGALRGEVDERAVAARVPRGEVLAIPPLRGRWRPTLTLGTASGELRLSGWPWRRSDLELVRTALGG